MYLYSAGGLAPDWVGCIAFDDGASVPSVDEVHAALAARLEQSDVWSRVLREVPGNLDFPYWVRDHTDVREYISADPMVGRTWTEVIDEAACLTDTAVPVQEHVWEIRTHHGVVGVPGCEGTATAVVIKCSHAVLAGSAGSSVTFSLFGPEFVPIKADGLPPAAEKFTKTRAVGRSFRVPFRAARFYGTALALTVREKVKRRRGEVPMGAPNPEVLELLYNHEGGSRRQVRNLTLPWEYFMVPGLSATELGITAISLAMQRHLTAQGEEPKALRAAVPVFVDWEELGVNRLQGGSVDLHPELAELTERAAAIKTSMRSERKRVSAPRMREIAKLQSKMTYRLVRRVPMTIGFDAHTVITSIRFDTNDWSLCGRPFADAVAVPPLGKKIRLLHCYCGDNTKLVLSVLSDPDVVADIDEYMEILHQSFQDVVAAFKAKTQ